MMILVFDNFVAGIFADHRNACDYLASMPQGTCMINTNDLTYPFWMLESTGDFFACQTEADALTNAVAVQADILYTITDDFQPQEPWTDDMGRLPHRHLTQ